MRAFLVTNNQRNESFLHLFFNNDRIPAVFTNILLQELAFLVKCLLSQHVQSTWIHLEFFKNCFSEESSFARIFVVFLASCWLLRRIRQQVNHCVFFFTFAVFKAKYHTSSAINQLNFYWFRKNRPDFVFFGVK